jgi:hypothetical protein
MTQAQLDGAVALALGELIRTVRGLGFSLVAGSPGDLEPEDLDLCVDCPFCGRGVAYPGPSRDGSRALAESDRCDVEFDFASDDVNAAPTGVSP